MGPKLEQYHGSSKLEHQSLKPTLHADQNLTHNQNLTHINLQMNLISKFSLAELNMA
jgi:hypothetical protein